MSSTDQSSSAKSSREPDSAKTDVKMSSTDQSSSAKSSREPNSAKTDVKMSSTDQSSSARSLREPDSAKPTRNGRKASKKPSGRFVITRVDPQSGGPISPEESCTKWRTICGVVAREKVKITVANWKELTETHRDSILEEILQSFDVPEGTEDVLRRAALMVAAKAWKNFKHMLIKDFVRKDRTPFELYPFVTTKDWEQFVIMKTTDGFQEQSEKNRALSKQNKHPHRLGSSGYAGHKKIWSKEDEEAEIYGKRPVFSSIPDDRARDWCRGRATYDAQGRLIWKNPADQEVYSRMIKLSSQSSQGPNKSHISDDLLTKGLGTKEHRGRTRGKGVIVPWGRAFPDEDEDARQSRKRAKSERMKAVIREELQEEMDAEIKRKVANIEATLRAQHVEEGAGGVVQASTDARGSSSTSGGPEAMLVCTSPVDLLKNPAPCKLHVRLSTVDYSLEAGLGVVYPPGEGKATHGVVLAPGFARVHLYRVHEYIKECPLPNIRPNDDMKVLSDTIGSYIQWPKRDIVLDQV